MELINPVLVSHVSLTNPSTRSSPVNHLSKASEEKGGEEKGANFIPCVNGNIFICVILSSSHPLSLPLKLHNKLTANYSVEIKTLIIINNAKYAIHAFHGHCLCGLEQ